MYCNVFSLILVLVITAGCGAINVSTGNDTAEETDVDTDTDTDADSDADADADTDADADADTDVPQDKDGDGYDDADCDDSDPDVHPGADEECDGKDNDCDGTIDEGCDTGTLCWYPDATDGVENCSTRVDEQDVEDYTCDLDQAVSNGELWSMADGWTADPVDEVEGNFDCICGTVTLPSDSDTLQVNLEFVGDDSGSDAEIPSNYGGTWWACANWYGHLSMAGQWTIDGATVAEEDLEVLSWGDGVDCFLQF